MKVILTTYTKTDKGLLLKTNFIRELMDYDIKDFLMNYNISLEELNYQVDAVRNSLKHRGYSSLIEFDGEFVSHIRFVS